MWVLFKLNIVPIPKTNPLVEGSRMQNNFSIEILGAQETKTSFMRLIIRILLVEFSAVNEGKLRSFTLLAEVS